MSSSSSSSSSSPPPPPPPSLKLSGIHFAVTGAFGSDAVSKKENRKEIEALIVSRGGCVGTAFHNQVSFLVVGEFGNLSNKWKRNLDENPTTLRRISPTELRAMVSEYDNSDIIISESILSSREDAGDAPDDDDDDDDEEEHKKRPRHSPSPPSPPSPSPPSPSPPSPSPLPLTKKEKPPLPTFTMDFDDRDIPSPPPGNDGGDDDEPPPTQLLVDKYAPLVPSDIIGQDRVGAQIDAWLIQWKNGEKPLRRDGKRVVDKEAALLLCGDPGIGKTSMALAYARKHEFSVLECNASDVRSKDAVTTLLKSATTTCALSLNGAAVSTLPSCIIMDEVDGMGAGDRGGVTALISFIKKTSAPIICICNDKFAASVKTLKEHCRVIDVYKPRVGDCVARLRTVVQREEMQVDSRILKKIVEEANCDLRQSLIVLDMISRTPSSSSSSPPSSSSSSSSSSPPSSSPNDIMRDVSFIESGRVEHIASPFDATRQLLSNSLSSSPSSSSLPYSARETLAASNDILPLFIAENYTAAATGGGDDIEALAYAANSMALGDIVDREIHAHQQWSALPTHQLLSVIMPSSVCGRRGFHERISFPSHLGKLSTINRRRREMNEFVSRGFVRKFEDMNLIQSIVIEPLVATDSKNTDEIERALGAVDATKELMKSYSLGRRDSIDTLDELVTLSSKQPIMKQVPPRVKRKLTAAFK